MYIVLTYGDFQLQVRWSRAFYSNFSDFIRDQERIVRGGQRDVANYLEGLLMFDNGTPTEWITSFFHPTQLPQIMSLVKTYGILYCLELTKYHFIEDIESEIDQVIKFIVILIIIYHYLYSIFYKVNYMISRKFDKNLFHI